MPAPSHHLGILADHYDALAVANGTPPSRMLLRALRARAGQLVAFDGGLNVLHRYDLPPGHVVGDLDSATPAALAWAREHAARIHRRPSPEEPDVVKGLRLCRELGFRRVLATGLVGNRLDHVLATVFFALQVRGIELHIVTDEVAVFPLQGRARRSFHVPEGHTVSWFGVPLAGPCSLSGVRWSFRNRLLRSPGFHSLSNQPLAVPVELTQRAGRSVFVISLFPTATE